MSFAGDELLDDPLLVIDRHASFAVPPDELWPWLVQIGKGRGGWYMPRWVEWLFPRRRRGVRSVVAEFQDVSVGTEAADWGPGAPMFRCVEVEAGRRLVWFSLRDPALRHAWPSGEPGASVLAFSWALLLEEDAAGGTHLHIRLRIDKGAWRARGLRFRLLAPLFDFFDWVTIVLLFAGLRERLDGA